MELVTKNQPPKKSTRVILTCTDHNLNTFRPSGVFAKWYHILAIRDT